MKTWTLIFPPHGDYLARLKPDVGENWVEDCYDLREAALLTMREAYGAAAAFPDGTPHRLSARTAKRLPANRLPLSRRQRLKAERRHRALESNRRRLDRMAMRVVGTMMASSPVLAGIMGLGLSRELYPMKQTRDALVVVRPNPEWENATHEIIDGRIQRRHILVVDEVAPGLTGKQLTDLDSVFSGRSDAFTSDGSARIVTP